MPQENSARASLEGPPPAAAIPIRPGHGGPLFLFSGGGADLHELDKLVDSLRTKRPLLGVPYWEAGRDGTAPESVEAMASIAHEMILSHQANGRYILVGYSLGGLIALEVARLLLDEGKAVAPPIIIDAIPRKSRWRNLSLLRTGPSKAWGRLERFLARQWPGGAGGPPPPQVSAEVLRCRTAYSNHRSRRFPGRISSIYARDEPGLGPLTPCIWKDLARDVSNHPISASHLEMLRVDHVTQAVAQEVDALVDAPRNAEDARSALILTALSWPKTARLASAMIQTGFFVDALAPSSSALKSVEGIGKFYSFCGLRPKAEIESAILDARPDILVPIDDFVASVLHELHASTAHSSIRALIERSLGDPKYYASLYNRQWMNDLARRLGVATPQTTPLLEEEAIPAALATTGFPAFIKTDGSWGGMGVRRVRTLEEARSNWRALRRSPGVPRSVKRALFDGDLSLIGQMLRRREPVICAQAEIVGPHAVISAVCRNGEVLSMVSAIAINRQLRFGPATSIRFHDSHMFDNEVKSMIKSLGLSGLCGFDFIISDNENRSYFIELNPRATPTCDLVFDGGDDLLYAYLDSIGGAPKRREISFPKTDIVAT
ncbi:thioesterase domain-containing protein [Methylocystis bryophila]|nr:thioesterase domain-containing protein [Methylocystis bryophila]